jgi:hypothetical protein
LDHLSIHIHLVLLDNRLALPEKAVLMKKYNIYGKKLTSEISTSSSEVTSASEPSACSKASISTIASTIAYEASVASTKSSSVTMIATKSSVVLPSSHHLMGRRAIMSESKGMSSRRPSCVESKITRTNMGLFICSNTYITKNI